MMGIVTKMLTRVKETSLRIDEGKCLGQRLRFPYNQRCGRDCSFKYNYNQSISTTLCQGLLFFKLKNY